MSATAVAPAKASAAQMPRTMRAAILVRLREPLVVADVELPALGVGQVLVRVHASSICGKQLDEHSGKRGDDPYLPHLLGHEGAGEVVIAGPGVTKVKPGDHVVLHWIKGSGLNSAPPRFQWNGQEVSAGWVTTFGEYSIASENRVTRIPADTDMAAAALLGCAVTTGLGIVFNDAQLKPGQSLLVFGAGGVGLNVLQGASLVHADPVVAVDVRDEKLRLAETFGASQALNGRTKDLEARLRAIVGPRGFDAVVDTTGLGSLIELGYRLASDTGRMILAGVPPAEQRITIDSFPIHFGRRLIGVHGGNTQPDIDIPRYLELYRCGWLKLAEQITSRYPLTEINAAMDAAAGGREGKCVIDMGA